MGEVKTGEDDEKRFPKGKVAGVDILLFPTAEKKVLVFGSTSERVCFVRLEGPTEK